MSDNPFAPPQAPSEPDPDASDLAVSIMCPGCRTKVHIGDDACSGCRRPVTKDEKRALQQRWEAMDWDVAKAAEDSYWARVSTALAASLSTIQGVLLMSAPDPAPGAMVVPLVLWALFAWSFQSPLNASIGALAVYSVWWLGQLLFATVTAFSGLLLRVLILSALMAGVAAEWNMRRRREALSRAKAARTQPSGP